MENEENREELNENKHEKNPPIESNEHQNVSKKGSSDTKVRDERLEKFKKGELGAADFRYNDDGPPDGSSRKLDIDTNADLK